MNYTLLLDKSENVRQIETEEQNRFILSIIETLNIPFEHEDGTEWTVLDRIRIRKTLSDYNISVIDDRGGNIKIYLDQDLIAEWHKASYCLREDPKQIDPKKRLYLQMTCSFKNNLEPEEAATDTEPNFTEV